MKQKQFTFKFYRHEIHEINDVPMDAITFTDSLKNRMNKKGYLVNNLKERKVIFVEGYLAKANVSFAERRKMQEKIDKDDFKNPQYLPAPSTREKM